MKRYALIVCIVWLCAPAFGQQEAPQPALLASPTQAPADEDDDEGPSLWGRFWDKFVELLLTPSIEKPFSVGAGMELTQNTRSGLVPEVFAGIDYDIDRMLAFGVRGGMTYGSKEPADSQVSVMEGVVFSRLYVYDFRWIRPYAQVGLGASTIREVDYEVTDVLGEGAVGARAHFLGWFADIGVRWGYPFRAGFGIEVGHSFLP
ncbi:MAG: hypothetical protein LBT33_08795 [Spirochaetia bacterium]|nr:hypothetical protein [Spirochaetia bacterium]